VRSAATLGEKVVPGTTFSPRVKPRLYDGPKDPDALLAYFGLEHFRVGQREAVVAALEGRDASIVMPTGRGKSLCYTLPGLATDKLTVVVSPLIALMSDQYVRLRDAGHPAAMLASGMPEDHNRTALAAIREGAARIVFCSPERFASKAFVSALQAREIALFAVDEAHCVSEWGHDFRPDYLQLHEVIGQLGGPPVMALTATATPVVALEIAERLGLRDPLLIHSGFDRPNLSFDVLHFAGTGAVARKLATLAAILEMPESRPAIVYAGTASRWMRSRPVSATSAWARSVITRVWSPRHAMRLSAASCRMRLRSWSQPPRSGWASTSRTCARSSTTRYPRQSSLTTKRSGAPGVTACPPAPCSWPCGLTSGG